MSDEPTTHIILRREFAAAALNALILRGNYGGQGLVNDDSEKHRKSMAERAWLYADAMLMTCPENKIEEWRAQNADRPLGE